MNEQDPTSPAPDPSIPASIDLELESISLVARRLYEAYELVCEGKPVELPHRAAIRAAADHYRRLYMVMRRRNPAGSEL